VNRIKDAPVLPAVPTEPSLKDALTVHKSLPAAFEAYDKERQGYREKLSQLLARVQEALLKLTTSGTTETRQTTSVKWTRSRDGVVTSETSGSAFTVTVLARAARAGEAQFPGPGGFSSGSVNGYPVALKITWSGSGTVNATALPSATLGFKSDVSVEHAGRLCLRRTPDALYLHFRPEPSYEDEDVSKVQVPIEMVFLELV
jgi:hypothetical protein